jgi:succinate-semialdehyde dehydrogenase/glutarate-semialdehyde dehydrogenase
MQAKSGKTTNVENSATGAVIGTVPNMGTLETRRAIELANAAIGTRIRMQDVELSRLL